MLILQNPYKLRHTKTNHIINNKRIYNVYKLHLSNEILKKIVIYFYNFTLTR